MGRDTVDQNELAVLEAERARYLSMIAYHESSKLRLPSSLHLFGFGTLICAILILAGFLSGRLPAASMLLIPILPLLGLVTVSPTLPVGETEVFQRLAKC